MFRIRRYRIFIVITIICTLVVYHLSRIQNWDDELYDFGLSTSKRADSPQIPLDPPAPQLDLQLERPATSEEISRESPTSSFNAAITIPTPISPPSAPDQVEQEASHEKLPEPVVEAADQRGQGRLEVDSAALGKPQPHWQPHKEHFPIPAGSLKAVPDVRGQTLRKLQAKFEAETPSEEADRLQKQLTIKEAFKHAWGGYVRNAMGHDEVKPVSKEVQDPFMAWGATLVDSLDSLWIMDLLEEFEEAVGQVAKIDFTTSPRSDIPLFETVIRYLGGLVSAYDLSLGKYPVLLDKAVELAEILMGAFDTPNRMPILYYKWAPEFAAKRQRASRHSVLAELGSLTLEFTRLAQITKEDRFYDAVARITDALQAFQMDTTLPGLWPIGLDASGCNRTTSTSPLPALSDETETSARDLLPDSDRIRIAPPIQATKNDSIKQTRPEPDKALAKRQLDDVPLPGDPDAATSQNANIDLGQSLSTPKTPMASDTSAAFLTAFCEHQPLALELKRPRQTYSIGAMADSTYEYFPKEYLLLGADNGQYRSMYQDAMKTVRETLLYRPMTKDRREILFVGDAEVEAGKKLKMRYKGTHLGCFAGGMFALGSRVFNIPDDLEIARQLTDGCVWAYESTATGIMPEAFTLVACDDIEGCAWNETKYHELLDPQQDVRVHAAEIWNEKQKSIIEKASEATKALEQLLSAQYDGASQNSTLEDDENPGMNKKRQVDYSEQAETHTDAQLHEEPPSKTDPSAMPPQAPASRPSQKPFLALKKVVSHEEYVNARILEERLPPSFVAIQDREYKLRPEAIESVFIMYRLTGDRAWQDKGWKMFTSIQMYTQTIEANSAINDVTKLSPKWTDTMESFWLAETLKYFYLLFSEPDLISLDDYVL